MVTVKCAYSECVHACECGCVPDSCIGLWVDSAAAGRALTLLQPTALENNKFNRVLRASGTRRLTQIMSHQRCRASRPQGAATIFNLSTMLSHQTAIFHPHQTAVSSHYRCIYANVSHLGLRHCTVLLI